jgi:hypothetical protein
LQASDALDFAVTEGASTMSTFAPNASRLDISNGHLGNAKSFSRLYRQLQSLEIADFLRLLWKQLQFAMRLSLLEVLGRRLPTQVMVVNARIVPAIARMRSVILWGRRRSVFSTRRCSDVP